MHCSSASVRLGVCVAFAIVWTSAALAQRRVTLDVAATNAQGEPVTDLQAGDVQVREDSKVRQIVFFRFAGDHRPSAPDAASPMVILFDHWNARMLVTGSAWQEFENTLKKVPLDRVYIDFVTGRGDVFPIRRLSLGEQSDDSAAVASKEPIAEMDQRVHKFQAMRDSEFDDPVQRGATTFEPLYRVVQQMGS